MSVIKMTDLDLAGKRVLIRADLNVPVKEGKVTSDARIRASLPTIEAALKQGAKVMVTSHLGRPTEGEYNEEFSLLPVVNYLKDKLNGTQVTLAKEYLDGVEVGAGELVVLENVRFNKGEKKDDETLAKKYAALCDVFVMDAFGTAHRAQASTHGVGKHAPIACAGPLLSAELEALGKVMSNPQRPLVAVVGGSKVSTKFDVLQSLVKIADTVIVGGGIANTFVAIDNNVGKSLYEPDFVEAAKGLRDQYGIPVPVDSRVGTEFSETAPATVKKVSEVADNEEIMDFGDETAQAMACLSSLTSAKAPRLSLTRSRTVMPSLWPAAVTPWRQSTCSVSKTRSPISLPAAALSWSSWKAKNCLRLPCLKSVRSSNFWGRRGCAV